MAVTSRIFGANLPLKIKQKLKFRQEFARSGDFVSALDAVQKAYPGGELMDGIDRFHSNYPDLDATPGVPGEASSRTPFVRMWTCVKADWDNDTDYEEIENKDLDTTKYEYKDSTNNGMIFRRERTDADPVIYEVGNFFGDSIKFGESINSNTTTAETDNEKIKEALASSTPEEFETNQNQFFMPPAGITNITSQTLDAKHTAAGVRKTTVQFTVHNFHDYDKIYSKYFLRPGAQVFVDFGWAIDGLELYSPEDVINNADFNDFLYNDGGDDPEKRGEFYKAIGDWDIIYGYVSNFSTTIGTKGEHNCSIDILSRNQQLWNISFDDEQSSQEKILNNLDNKILRYASDVLFPGQFEYDNDENVSDEEWVDIWKSAASHLLSGEVKMSEDSLKLGVYWKEVMTPGSSGTKSVPSTSDNIYVSYGFFEDQILNEEFAKVMSTGDIGNNSISNKVVFDSRECWVSITDVMKEKQQILQGQSQKLKYLLPHINTSIDETYNSLVDKRPTKPDIVSGFTNYCNSNKKIPLREIFIPLSLIKNSFLSARNLNDAMIFLLAALNGDSSKTWDLALNTNTIPFTTLSTVDKNSIDIKDVTAITDMQNFYDEMFLFEPHSPSSIVKTLNLTYRPGNDKITSKIGIQTMGSGGRLKFPLSDVHDANIIENMLNGVDLFYLPSTHNNDDIKEKDKNESHSSISEGGQYDVASIFGSGADSLTKDTTSERYKEIQARLSKARIKEEESQDREIKAENRKKFNDTMEKDLSVKAFNTFLSYYEAKSLQNNREIKPVLIPIELSLVVDGFAGFVPGDIFNIDYLPERYRGRVYFQLTKYQHTITPGTWDTTLNAVMKIRPDVGKTIMEGSSAEITKRVMSKYFLDSALKLTNISEVLPGLSYIEPEIINENVKNTYPTLDYIFKIKSNYNMSSDKHEVDVLDIITQSLPKELEDDSDLKSFEEAVNALDNLKKVDIVDDDKKQDIAIKVSLDKSDPDDTNSGNYKILCFGPKWYIVDSNISDTDLKDIVKNLEIVFATADPDVE